MQQVTRAALGCCPHTEILLAAANQLFNFPHKTHEKEEPLKRPDT